MGTTVRYNRATLKQMDGYPNTLQVDMVRVIAGNAMTGIADVTRAAQWS